MKTEQNKIDGKICNIFIKGENAPVFIFINEPSLPIGGTQIIEKLENINSKFNYILIELLINNWTARFRHGKPKPAQESFMATETKP